MSEHLVCLSFDFDAMSGMIARGLTTPTPVSRGEFGVVGARRLMDLLKRFDLPSSWFIPGVVAETYPRVCAEIAALGCEIGHHGYTHTPPADLARAEEEDELVRGTEAIERLTGRRPSGYRSPSWDLSPHTIDLLLGHDFVYDSSMMGHDISPYRARDGDVVEAGKPIVFGPETRLIEMPISWSLDDFPHFEHIRAPSYVQQGLMNAGDVMENWYGDFDYMARTADWGVLTYTCHPYVIGRGHRLLAFERLIVRLLERGARFVTLDDAAKAYDARQPLTG